MATCSIHVSDVTLKKLSTLRHSEKESYDEVIARLLDDVEEDFLSLSDIADIKKGLNEIRRGKILNEEDLLKEKCRMGRVF